MALSIIVAVDKNLAIGKGNNLLAHIKPDLEYFKKITSGHTIVMGYNTFCSLPSGPLPNRRNVVLTRKNINISGAEVINSIEDLLEFFKKNKEEEIFIIGGESVYNQLINHCDKMYITHIFYEFKGADVFFPPIGEEWQVKNTYCDKENINHKYPHVFVVYKKNVAT